MKNIFAIEKVNVSGEFGIARGTGNGWRVIDFLEFLIYFLIFSWLPPEVVTAPFSWLPPRGKLSRSD